MEFNSVKNVSKKRKIKIKPQKALATPTNLARSQKLADKISRPGSTDTLYEPDKN